MMMPKKADIPANDYALDPRAQCARYGKSWVTLCRWHDNAAIRYPSPDFYVGKTPFVWLSTLNAWELTLPERSPLKGREVPSAVDRSEAACPGAAH